MDGEAYGGREIGRPSPEQGSRGTLLPPIAAKTVKAVGGLGGRREEDGGLRQKLGRAVYCRIPLAMPGIRENFSVAYEMSRKKKK